MLKNEYMNEGERGGGYDMIGDRGEGDRNKRGYR